MNKLKCYDWSVWTRKSLFSKIKSCNRSVINKCLSGQEITKIVRNHLRNKNIPVNVVTKFDETSEINSIAVSAQYEGYKDKKNQKFITIFLYFNPKYKLNLTYSKFRRTCQVMTDMILHELIHTRQYRRRSYKDIPGFTSVAESKKLKNKQEYLGHNDEIDAYSFNIVCELNDEFKGNQKEIIKYLNSDLRDRRLKSTWYRTYLETFDFNHNHKIIKKLKKRIIFYMPYFEIGKPYKTAEWLKK